VLGTPGGNVLQRAPVIYQLANGVRQPVTGNYVLQSASQAGFTVGSYDTSRPLYIDPVLGYSGYLGGSGADNGNAIAVDATGNAYIAGSTTSPDFPGTSGGLQSYAGAQDAFITKLDPTGSVLVYSTYLGGSAADEALGIAVDSAGNAYVTGDTASTDFPKANAYQTSLAGTQNAFIAKINAAGNDLLYSSYLGGTGSDAGQGIAVDVSGIVYVAGKTTSANASFPTTTNAYLRTYGGGTSAAFVTKLDPTQTTQANQLLYSTYLGGTTNDMARGVAVDPAGKIYVTGSTAGSFPIVSAFQSTYGGGAADAFVAKFDPSQSGSSSLVNSSYLGGGDLDEGWGIALDAANNAYVTGRTRSNNFTTTPGAYQTTGGGGACLMHACGDAFVAKINFPPSGNASLAYSTYVGGTGDDEGKAIAVDAYGRVWITGSTTGSFPVTANATQSTSGGGTDAFVTEVDAAGATLLFSTYLGGSGTDIGQGIAVDPMGNAYVTGLTQSSNFPVAGQGLQATLSGTSDAFVSQFSPLPLPPRFTGISPDTGISASDNLTQSRRPTLSGLAIPGHNVTVTRNGPVAFGIVQASPNSGVWTLPYPAGQPDLADGVYSFTATDTDPVSGGTSEPSREFLVTIENTPPAVTLFAPATTYSLAPEVRVVASDVDGVPQDATGDYQVFLDVDLNGNGTWAGQGYTTAPLHDGFADFLVTSGTFAPLAAGHTYPMRARIKNRAGVQGTSSVQNVTIQNSVNTWPATAEVRTWDPLTGEPLLQTGDVQLVQPLKLYQSPGQAMSLGAALVYNSDSVDQRPIIRAAIQSDNGVALPQTITVPATWDGVGLLPAQSFSTTGRFPGELLTVAVQIGAGVTTGRHTWSLQITGTPVVEPLITGSTFLVDNRTSPFGAGWSFSLVDRLIDIPADVPHNLPAGKLRVFGKAGWRFYTWNGSAYVSPPGDNGTLALSGTNYIYKTPDGTKWTFDNNGKQIGWADATADNLLTFAYDGSNRLYTMQAADNSLSTFSYDSGSGLLQSIAGPYGRQYNLTHTGNLLTQIQNADNGVRTVTYTNQTFPNTVTGEQIAGENRAWTYGSNGRLTTFTQGTGADTTNIAITPAAVQGLGQMTAGDPQAVVTDGLNHTTRTNMDSAGRPTQQLAGDGGLTVWNRDGNGFVTTMIDPLGRTTTYVRDSQGDILQVQQPDGTSKQFVYDTLQGQGPKRLISFTNERNKTTTFAYYSPTDATDPDRHLHWMENAQIAYTTLVWDMVARMLLSITNPRNVTTTFTNDPNTRETTQITDDYIPNWTPPPCWGNVQTQICPSDTPITTTISYSPTGPDYDPCFYRGQQWANGHPTTLCERHDAMSRLKDFRDGYQSGNERRTTVLYDAAGKIISYTTGLGTANPHPVTVSFAYDTAGRPTKLIAGYGSPIRRQQLASYDAGGNLASLTDPLGHRQTYGYDGAGRVVATTDLPGYPRQRTSTMVYDLAGNTLNAIDPLGRVTQWTYDSRDRPIQETDAVGLPEQRSSTVLYDGVGNITSMTTGQGVAGYAQPATSNFIYDALDRVTVSVEAVGVSGLQRTATLVRDENGNVVSVTRAQTYDGAPTPTLVTTSYEYDAHDRAQLITEAVGAPEQRTTSVVYDATNNVSYLTTGIANTNPHQATGHFIYDELNRVTGMQEALGDSNQRSTTMIYDATDNLLYLTQGQETPFPQPLQTAFRYDTLNRTIQVTDAYGTSLARTSRFAYNDPGQETAYTDPLNQTTRTAGRTHQIQPRRRGEIGTIPPAATFPGFSTCVELCPSRNERRADPFFAAPISRFPMPLRVPHSERLEYSRALSLSCQSSGRPDKF
jgi:YD repeat-containing protein